MSNNILKLLQSANQSSTKTYNRLDELALKMQLDKFDRTGFMRNNPNPEYYGGQDSILSAIGGVTGTRSLLDMALKKYGSKAFNKIRELIDYDRAIAMSHPEKSYYLQRGLARMIKTVEPNKKTQKYLNELIYKEDMEEWTVPFAKKVLKNLKVE